MTFAIDDIRRLAPVARVVVAATKGSVPRDVGAAMLVTCNAIEGTIGGGALELNAIRRARVALEAREDRFDKVPLGPALGQCCGGSVSVLTEIWDNKRLNALISDVIARPLPGADQAMPLSVQRSLAAYRAEGKLLQPGVVSGWMIETVTRPTRQIWVWGAGHVGRAIVATLAPLPDISIVWADSGKDRFPADISGGVETLIAENPADLVSLVPSHAEHLVLTYSHALDLELCHRILGKPFGRLGLIGSATKRARFRSRLRALGHSETQIDRIDCPIGDPALGKHPQEIALGVATDILRRGQVGANMIGKRA